MSGLLLLGMGWFPDQPGGLNRYFRSLQEALSTVGPTPVAVVIGPARDAPPSVRSVSQHSAPLPSRLLRYAVAARRLGRQAETVDAHFSLYAAAALLAGVHRRRRFVIHFQGPWADESAAIGHRHVVVAVKRHIERFVYSRADALITLSPAFKQLLVERYGIAPWRIDVIEPGVNVEWFAPGDSAGARALLSVPSGAWLVVTVRRLVPRMGIDSLLEAWDSVVRARPEALLLVCGDGPQRPELEGLARKRGIGTSVRFLGRVDEDILLAVYQAADLSVVPTSELEGFGLVTLESLACGTPVVVTDVEGLADAPRRLQRDLVVPRGNVDALAQRLVNAAIDPASLPPRSACRQFAEGFSWAEVARTHVDLYRPALLAHDQRPLRIVYLDHVAELSGGELALARLLSALHGVEPHVILAERGPLVDRLQRLGISVEVIPMNTSTRQLRRFDVRPGPQAMWGVLNTLLYSLRLARRLRVLQPDLVHTNSLKAALYGGLAARISGSPLVWHVRDRIALDYLPRTAVRLVRTLVARLPHGVIANSEATMATIGPPIRSQQLRAVIASPIDIGEDADRLDTPYPPSGDDLRVIIVGRLDPWKGQHVFLRAFAQALGGRQATALVVGSPMFEQEAYESELHQLADQLGISDQVHFLGQRDDVPTLLRSCHILVHCSTIAEPFGQVCVEGMAAGLAVIAANAGGPAEVITPDIDGLLVAPNDITALAAALRRLAQDPATRSALGTAAIQRAQNYRPEALAEQTMILYRKVLNRRHSPLNAAATTV